METSFALIGFLIVFPLVVAALLLVVRPEGPRKVVVCISAALIAVASVALVLMNLGASCTLLAFESEALDFVGTGVSLVVAAVVIGFAIRYRNLWAALLAVVQIAGTLVLEFVFAHEIEVPYGLYFDSLSLLMTFIIGVVGSGICVYALGYMEDFQAHEPAGAKDRRPTLFRSCSCSCRPCTSSCSPTTWSGCTPAGRSPRSARSSSSATRRPTRPSGTPSARSS
ncbi:hypothetical protein [uncultured Adlercreutzia sp.]|uniref:hypothetical protein n=1 Tax=uncultured Adlercreutzia sp. TaxID=875803 RepID=UPI0026F39B27|nr:hypothetical protein [uncultured Adlercreutzia sp.]